MTAAGAKRSFALEAPTSEPPSGADGGTPPAADTLGLLGGTFDPVHAGHLRFAEEARRRLGLDAVALVPAGAPVHRPPARATADQRLAMLTAAIRGRRGLYVDGRELAGEGPRWTIDTLISFRAESARRPLCLLIGADQLRVLDTWRRWRELPDYAHLVAARRTGAGWPLAGEVSRWAEARRCDDPRDLRTRPAGCLFMLDLPALDLSSTAVRKRCAAGENLGDLVPEGVRDYIQRENLYSDDA